MDRINNQLTYSIILCCALSFVQLQHVLTWWCVGQRIDGDNETGLTCWQVQPDSWCGGTYPRKDECRNIHGYLMVCKCVSFSMRVDESVYKWWTEAPKLTLVRVILNWMVRMTTSMSKLPSEISVNDRSVYHEMFFNTCEREKDTEIMLRCWKLQELLSLLLQVTEGCIQLFTHHLVDGAIEGIVLSEDEQNNEGHVDMVRISVLHMVKDLEDGQHLKGREGESGRERLRMCVGVVTEETFIKSMLQDFWLGVDPPLQCVHLLKDIINHIHASHVHKLLNRVYCCHPSNQLQYL